jgi:hypothetical protein
MTMTHYAAPAALAELHAFLAQGGEASVGSHVLAPQPDIFNDIMRESMRTHFDTKTVRSIQCVISAYSLGFQAAKQGKFNTAHIEFNRGDELLAVIQQTHAPEVNTFLNCLTLPFRAYYEHGQGHFDEATARTLAAIANIVQLEAQMPILHMARVQQLHNMSRVSFKRGDATGGAVLVHELLKYLSTGMAPALAGDWHPSLLQGTPPALQAGMFSQVFVEMVRNLAHFPEAAQRRPLFTVAFGQLAAQPAVLLELWAPYAQWLVAYEALLAEAPAAYEPLVLAYLAQPGHDFDQLKLALLLELHRSLPGESLLHNALPTYARRALWVADRQVNLLR